MTDETTRRSLINREVLGGVAIMVVGLALLADVREHTGIDLWASGWTLVLATIGLIRIIEPAVGRGDERPSRRTGVWLLSVGIWGFLSQNRLFGLEFRTSWSLLVIVAGVIIVWWAVDDSRPSAAKGA